MSGPKLDIVGKRRYCDQNSKVTTLLSEIAEIPIEKMPAEDPNEKSEPKTQPATPTVALPRSTLELAWAEWDLIQKKVDSVSNFPFTVKAWSVAVSGFLLGLGKGFEFSKPVLWLTLLVPIIFKAIESKHNAIRDALGKRAELLERMIERLKPLSIEEAKLLPSSLQRAAVRVPGVALSLIMARNRIQKTRIDFQLRDREKWYGWIYRTAKEQWHKRVVPFGDNLFYLLQIGIIIGVIVSLKVPTSPSSLLLGTAATAPTAATAATAATAPTAAIAPTAAVAPTAATATPAPPPPISAPVGSDKIKKP